MNHAQQLLITHNTCFIQAYAKINLTLDVLGRRTDSYHELVTVMQTIDLHDTLCLTTADDNHIHITCNTPTLSDEQNLAVCAAQLIRQHFAITQGIHIELYKRIPMAAGLGGGSSDAAAVLLALQQWWQLPLTASDLLDMAAALGSDVPFFLSGGLALCEGRGERVTPLHQCWPPSMRWLLLLKPAISVSTASVFRALTSDAYTDGSASRSVTAALQAGRMPPADSLHNSLELPVLQRYPEVADARHDLLEAGASIVRLSGSGPTLFAPFSELAPALQTKQQLQAKGYEVYVSRTVFPSFPKSSELL
jgi:4-diphosphocytidyl-2-C-methyl-D-erythritol kinase